MPVILQRNIDYLDIVPFYNLSSELDPEKKENNTMLVDQYIRISNIGDMTGFNSNPYTKLNFYHNDVLAKHILSFCLTFPMWTEIFTKKDFGGSGCDFNLFRGSLENYYSDIEHILQMPSSSDFLTSHISFLQERMSENRGVLGQHKKHKKRSLEKNTEIHAYLEEKENWKNKASTNDEKSEEKFDKENEEEDKEDNNETKMVPKV